jgi:1,4-alpha-glucan branching enzyme
MKRSILDKMPGDIWQKFANMRILYAYSENFVLPLSHDEVVHMKRSILDKMPGDIWQKFANMRILYAYQYAHPGKKLLFMGGEFGQWEEWSESKQLDWEVFGIDKHAGTYNMLCDLNRVYRENPAMYYHDFNHDGFQWLSCDDIDNSVLAFMRNGPDDAIICVFNFTPQLLENYVIGTPVAGSYHVIFNSDAAWYGGSDSGVDGEVQTVKKDEHGFAHSLTMTLPPLGAMFLKLDNADTSS